jgi:hypothetical protein
MAQTVFDLDQQRCDTQAALAAQLFFNGESDGFYGIRPTSTEIEYLLGYSAGIRRKLSDIQRQGLLLQQEGQAVEAMLSNELEF